MSKEQIYQCVVMWLLIMGVASLWQIEKILKDIRDKLK